MERIRVADRPALDADKALKHSRLNRGIRRIIQINQQNISHETAQPSSRHDAGSISEDAPQIHLFCARGWSFTAGLTQQTGMMQVPSPTMRCKSICFAPEAGALQRD